MILTVVRAYQWPPDTIGGLFLDDADYRGLQFWYNDVVEQEKKIPKPKGNKKE